MELKNILLTHFSGYPRMLPCDAVKLIYQNHFGPSHFITDQSQAYDRLVSEYSRCKKSDELYVENIGNGITRLYLGGLNEYSLNTVNNIFCLHDTNGAGDSASFLHKCELLEALAYEGAAPFSHDEFRIFFDEYLKKGCPDIHHSRIYRENYSPSYRLISSYYAFFLELIFEIDRIILQKGRAVIALDGDCASGKSTLAKALERIYLSSSVIHMDDFFLPSHMRTPERLSLPGANVHYERFASEVINGIESRKDFAYRKFDCSIMDYSGETASVCTDSKLVIVEGSYSLRPEFISSYDIKVFLEVSAYDQLSRLKDRCDGNDLLSRFINEWIPMEKKYQEYYRIKKLADFTYIT